MVGDRQRYRTWQFASSLPSCPHVFNQTNRISFLSAKSRQSMIQVPGFACDARSAARRTLAKHLLVAPTTFASQNAAATDAAPAPSPPPSVSTLLRSHRHHHDPRNRSRNGLACRCQSRSQGPRHKPQTAIHCRLHLGDPSQPPTAAGESWKIINLVAGRTCG